VLGFFTVRTDDLSQISHLRDLFAEDAHDFGKPTQLRLELIASA
jgi:hypothetical protein